MKKHNSVFSVLICFILLFTVWSGFISCKSVPTGNNVDPLNLLDGDSDFYIAIPKSADPQLFDTLIKKNIPGVSQKDLKRISQRTSKVYVGILNSISGSYIQAAAEGDIPVNYIPCLLTKRKGWFIRDSISLQPNSAFVHKIYNSNNIDLSFPSSNIVCIGRNVDFMLDKYNSLAFSDILDGVSFKANYSELPDDLFYFLKGAEEDIRFYSKETKNFLENLTGQKLDLKLIDIQGIFSLDENNLDIYNLNMILNFQSKKFLKAGRALIRMAFGLSSSDVVALSDNVLEIKKLQIKKEQLYKILAL